MPPPAEGRATGLVLAAGDSSRLGRPKQTLPYGEATLLGHVLDTARTCSLHQLLCVLGGDAGGVRAAVDLSGVQVVENASFARGCSSSVAAALGAVDSRSEVLVLLLGDQPGVRPDTVSRLLAGRGEAPLAVCAYDDGLGHPIAFSRHLFGELAELHGDKAMWKVVDRHRREAVEVPIAGPVPRDVDTWEDYRAAIAEVAA